MRPKKVILCVGLNETALGIRKFVLGTHGYRVVGVVGGLPAIKAFKAQLPDIVVTDFVLPDMFGDELVKRLKDVARFVPMIVTTVFVHHPATHEANAFLTGNNDTAELLARIKILISHKRGPKPSIIAPALEARRTA